MARAAASRSRRTSPRTQHVDVQAYGGEVESLDVAESAGVGVRVIVDQREGFA